MKYALRITMLMTAALLVAQDQKPTEKSASQSKPGLSNRAKIERSNDAVTVTADSARPLSQALAAIAEEYGWFVSYEDPPYQNPELVDATDPGWRAEHPKAKGVTRPAGGLFKAKYVEGSRDNSEPQLSEIIAAYNESGNPGKFELRRLANNRMAVVGTSVRDQSGQDVRTVPVLDTKISIPTNSRSAAATIEVICKELSARSGFPVLFLTGPNNILYGSEVTVGGEDMSARTLLMNTLDATHRTLSWRLLYDADIKTYGLNIWVVSRISKDSKGRDVWISVDESREVR